MSIVKRCKKADLMQHFVIPTYRDGNEFLFLVAQKIGRLKKGGIPDVDNAARTVLKHWNEGKIPFFTVPPEKYIIMCLNNLLISSIGNKYIWNQLLFQVTAKNLILLSF